MNQLIYNGNIASIRALEDSIRATKKYTEGIGTIRKKHPIQGENFPSRTFCKYYEIYPDIEISWDMPMGKAMDLFWGDCKRIDIIFHYDYKNNSASMRLNNRNGEITELVKSIPGFGNALLKVYHGDKE